MAVPGAILSGAGDFKPIDFSTMFHGMALGEERRNTQERLRLARESRQNQVSKEFAQELDPAQLKGDIGDAPIGSEMQDINKGVQERLKQGASENQIRLEFGPRFAKISDYMTKAKTIDAQIEQVLKGMPKDAGYDFDKIRYEAKKRAFGSTDENGNFVPTSVDKIDPTKNYVADLVRNNPELVTNMGGWDKYAKELPKATSSTDITTVTGPGTTSRKKVSATKNYLEDFEKDANGNIIGITPKYETLPSLDENGKQVMGKDGKPAVITDPETGKPMRLLSTPLFNDLLSKNPNMADAIRGETKRHFIAAGQTDIPENDPRYKAYAQHLAYQVLQQNNNSTFHTEDLDKQSAAAAKQEEMKDPQYWKNLQKETYVKKSTEIAAENANKLAHPELYPDRTPKAATSEVIANVFTNPESIIGGEAPSTTPDKKQAYDISAGFPKLGPGYEHIFYDAKNHQLLLYKKGNTKPEIITSRNAGPFMTKVAQINKEPISGVKKALTDNNYSSGGFDSGKSDKLAAPILEQETKERQELTKVLTKAVDDGNKETLKDKRTPDGNIIRSAESPWYSKGWTLTIEDPKTKVKSTKEFKNKEELKAYLTPAEDLINKYKP